MNNISLNTKIKLALKYPKTTYDFFEDKFLRRKIPPFPRLVKIYVTNVCNLNCPMCVNAAYRMKNLKGSNLTLKDAKKIIPELSKYKPFIYFSGGEPLVNPDTIPIVKAFSKVGMFTSLTTNGFVLDYFARQVALSGLDAISISLDSDNAKDHDNGRGTKGTFDRLISGLEALKKERKKTGTPVNIKLNTVIRGDNYFKLSEIYDFMESMMVEEWSLQHISYLTPKVNKIIKNYHRRTGIGDDVFGVPIAKDKLFTKKEIEILQEQIIKIKKKSKRYKTRLSIRPEIDDLTAYYSGTFPSKKSWCTIPFDTLAFYDNGKIATGCLGYVIGNLGEKRSIKEIWQSEKTRKFQKLIIKNKLIPPCFRCCGLNYKFT